MSEKTIIILFIAMTSVLIIFSLYMAAEESDVRRQQYIICISAGGSWKDGDCRLMVPEKPK